MKQKHIAGGGIIVLAAGLAVVGLVKFHNAASAESDETETAPSVVTVQVGALKRMTLHSYINGYATVEPAPAMADQPAAGAALAPPGAGIVAKVNVVEGRHVEKGDVLVELNSGATTADYARQEVDRQRKLFAQQNTSLKNLQDAEAQMASLRITAPLSGTVTRINVKPGEAVDVNTVVAEVMDLSRLAVSVKIPASEAGALKTGEEVQVLAKPPVSTLLSFISPAVDANDGTVLANALLPADSGLRPGQFVQLKIVTTVHTNCLAAPAESIVTDENGGSVIALVKGDEATQTPVKIGLRENDWVEIEAPEIKEDDSIVTVGAYGLPEKTKIRVANSTDESPAARLSQSQ